MDFGRATLPVAIPQGMKKETGGTGIQPQPGLKQGLQIHKKPPCPVPSPRTQTRLQGALSPQTGLGPPLGATEHGLAVPRH